MKVLTPAMGQQLALVREIVASTHLIAHEITRDGESSRAVLEAWSGRMLKQAAQLYTSTLLPPLPATAATNDAAVRTSVPTADHGGL